MMVILIIIGMLATIFVVAGILCEILGLSLVSLFLAPFSIYKNVRDAKANNEKDYGRWKIAAIIWLIIIILSLFMSFNS